MPNTREKLMELLERSLSEDRTGREIRFAGDDVVAGIMPSIQEWVPVSERLPELYEEEIKDEGETIKYMVSDPFLAYTDKGIVAVCVYSVQDGKEWWNEDSGAEHKVTHWMPLPEPPKGE